MQLIREETIIYMYIYGILYGSENATDNVQRLSSFSSIHNLKYGLIVMYSQS